MATKAFYGGVAGPVTNVLNYVDDGLSPTRGSSMWQTFPMLAVQQDPSVGNYYLDHFTGFTTATGGWISTQATSGTSVQGVLTGGTLKLDAGATTAHQGIQVQRTGGYVIPAAAKQIWFECKLKTSVLTLEFLAGLATVSTTLISAGAISGAADLIGFSSVTGDGVILPQAIKASTAATIATSNTLVAGTYVRLGFVVTGLSQVDYYVNGTLSKTMSTGSTNIPVSILTPSFVCQTSGTSQPVIDIDYYALGYLL